MMILTAKVDFKKIMLILVAVAAVLLTLILIFGNRSEAEKFVLAQPYPWECEL